MFSSFENRAAWAVVVLPVLLALSTSLAQAQPLSALDPTFLAAQQTSGVIVTNTPQAVEFQSPGVTVRVQRHPWHMQFLDPNRNVFVQESPEVPPADSPGARYGTVGFSVGGRWFHATDLIATSLEEGGAMLAITAATDDPTGRTIAVTLQIVSPAIVRIAVRPTNPVGVSRTGVAFATDASTHFFGLGEQFGSVDLRGQSVVNWVRDRAFADEAGTYKAVPFFVTNKGYGLVVESYARSTFDFASLRPDAAAVQVDDSSFQYSILYGPEPLAVVSRFADLVGHWPLPPRWAFGVWRNSTGGQGRVVAEARQLRQLDVPVTALFVYDASDDDLNLGWPWHIYGPIMPGWYSNISAMNVQLHAMGYHVLGYLRADVAVDRRSFKPLAQRGYFIRHADGSTYLNRAGAASLDFTNPGAVAWWQRVVRYVLGSDGFDGWMQDFGELAPADGVYASGLPGRIEHDRYPLLYARITYQAAVAAKPDYVSLARSATLGSQPYLRLAWPGDQSVDWSPTTGLPSQIPAMLSAALSGLPDYAPDVAGFSDPVGGALSAAAEKELWIRWVELGALSPVFRDLLGARAHGAINIWTDADTLRIYRDYARLHASLIPYIYSYARLASDTGQPILRHPFLEFPSDPTTYGLDHEFFLGDALLVCPVLSPGARASSCYVPQGSWIDVGTGQVYSGPAWATLPAPLERIPILARAGAIVPTGDPDAITAGLANPTVRSADDLTIRVFPHPGQPRLQSSFTLYDGARLSYQAEPGRATFGLLGSPVARRVEVQLPVPVAPASVVGNGVLFGQKTGGGTLPIGAYRYDPAVGALRVVLSSAGQSSVTVRW